MVINQQQHPDGIPFNREVMFSTYKHVYKRGVEKRQTKLLKKIACVKPFMKDKEEVLLVTTGCSPVSMIEQLLTGWIIFYLKRSLLVFTNQRILHIPATLNYSYRNSIAQIDYANCACIQVKGRSLVVRYADGDKETFYYLAGSEAKKIKTLLPTLSIGGHPGTNAKRVHLCPHCTKELTKEKYVCPNCRLEFKERVEAKRISLVYPGGGYFYTGHPLLGIIDAITETVLLILVIMSACNALSRQAGLGEFVFFSLALAIEKAVTVYHANHFVDEFIPKEKDIKCLA